MMSSGLRSSVTRADMLPIGSRQRLVQRHLVVEASFAVDLDKGAEDGVDRCAYADAPTKTVGEIDVVRIGAEDEAAEAGKLDVAVSHNLAHDDVDLTIDLAGRCSRVRVASRQLDETAHRDRHRIQARLRQQVKLGPNQKVADLVTAELIVHQGVLVDDATHACAIGIEQGADVTVDPRQEPERAEDFRVVAEADRERAHVVLDVGETLLPVDVGTLTAG